MKTREYVCHSCGRTLEQNNGILQEDALFVRKEWGYFSRKDLQVHELILCEECYDRWVGRLKIPPQISEKKEVMSPA